MALDPKSEGHLFQIEAGTEGRLKGHKFEEVVTEAPTQEEAKEDLQVVIDELNKRIDELNAKISELELQNQKLSKQPSAKPVNVKGLIGGDNKFERMLAIMNGSAFK